MSAPEKIWAWCFQPSENGNWGDWGGYARQNNMHALDDRERATGAEYIRADLTPPAADYVAGLRAASARCKLEVENCRQLESFRNEASELYFDGLADAQIVIDRLAEDALAARPASPDTRVVPRPEAVDALAAYQQADMDGIMVLVSRQAIEECLPSLRAIIGGQDRG